MANVSFVNIEMDVTLEEAFPDVDPGISPFGSRVIIQVRTAKGKTKGGILLAAETKDTEQWNTQVGKVVATGPLAFRSRTTGKPWPEGVWCEVGQFVRFPKHVGDKWQVAIPDREGEDALFAMFNDGDLLGLIKGDPLKIKAFV